MARTDYFCAYPIAPLRLTRAIGVNDATVMRANSAQSYPPGLVPAAQRTRQARGSACSSVAAVLWQHLLIALIQTSVRSSLTAGQHLLVHRHGAAATQVDDRIAVSLHHHVPRVRPAPSCFVDR